MIDKKMNMAPRYIAPIVKVVSISTKAHILQGSIVSSVNVNGYSQGSESYVGLGDDEDE